ncbi:hypothetical protein [Streptomyces reniochalinae]|nr:hypothetical protein [Streptomyces reniochalinae]
MLAHGCVIERVSGWVPPARAPGAQLLGYGDVTDLGVRSRAGAATRYRARPGEALSHLAVQAAAHVLDGAARPGALPHVTSTPGDRARARRGARARARALLAGRGASTGAYHATAPHPQERGARVTVRATADACPVPGDTSHVDARATAAPADDVAEAAMTGRLLPHRPSAAVPKGVLSRGPRGRRRDRGRADRGQHRARAGPGPSRA